MKTLDDLTAPRQVEKRLLEKDLQKQCVEWARGRGYWARKFSSQSQRSVPDYLFASGIHHNPGYRCKFACEFKRPGCPRDPLTGLMSTEAQIEEQNAMRVAGWYVFECDDFEHFKEEVDRIEQEVARFGYI